MNPLTATIGAVGMIIASAFTSWATASGKISSMDTKIEIVQERENNHYAETQRQLVDINKKLDQLIITKTAVR